MKKKNIRSLALNKKKISQLQEGVGGAQVFTTDQITASTCSCITCMPGFCPTGQSRFICPPRPTEDCTIDCTFITCPPPTTGFEIP
ncbi:hypothetical protein [uncultured Kordia sp.]|uniref:hypothetical protein n=1 Tax=uncultured Kordia sp. TaxID=507699 RepID=UPI0026231B21|nr:hypothetical protein [uncultured Kordia sp.]